MNCKIGSLKYALNGVYSGGTPTAGDDSLYDDGGIPFVTIGDMSSQTPIISTKRHLSEGGCQSKNLKTVQKGTILLSMYATIGLPNILGIDACISQAIIALFSRRDQNPRFLYWWLMHYRGFLEAEVAGSTQGNLNAERVKNIRFIFIDIATQRQLADFLDRETARIDLLIEKKQRLVALLGEKVRRYVSSIFERLAHENRIWRLKHVLLAGLAYGANEPSDGDDPDDVRYIRITDIDPDGNLRDDTFKSLPRERIRDYILEDGDILFARSGATVGKSFIYREHMGECCYAGYLIRARVNTKLISQDFLKHFTSTDQYWNHILGTNIQATIQNVSAEKYANLAFPLPPLSVQREISARVMRNEERYAATKSRVNASIDRLKEYRSALITAAVTGQIDVQAYARSGTTDRRLDAIQEEMNA